MTEYNVFYVKDGMSYIKAFTRKADATKFYSYAKGRGYSYGYRFVEKDF